MRHRFAQCEPPRNRAGNLADTRSGVNRANRPGTGAVVLLPPRLCRSPPVPARNRANRAGTGAVVLLPPRFRPGTGPTGPEPGRLCTYAPTGAQPGWNRAGCDVTPPVVA